MNPILGTVLGRRPNKQLRQQVAALRAELDELKQVEALPTAFERENPLSAEAFRRRVLGAEVAAKRGGLEVLLRQAAQLNLNVEEPARKPSGHSSLLSPLHAFTSVVDRCRPVPALLIVGATFVLLLVVGRAPEAFNAFSSLVGYPELPEATNSAIELAPAINEPAEEKGKRFFAQELKFDYRDGRAILSGQPSPSGEFWVDDSITITVVRPDGSTSSWSHTFNVDCYSNSPVPAKDLTDMFAPGRNVITVELFDVCGATFGTSGALLLTTVRD